MEHILAGLDIRRETSGNYPLMDWGETNGLFAAAYRAIHLARRIQANVHILLIVDSEAGFSGPDTLTELESTARSHLELLIEKARSNGLRVQYYISTGIFETEIVRLVAEKKITLLILGLPPTDSKVSLDFTKVLNTIRQNVRCAIELVRRKEPITRRK